MYDNIIYDFDGTIADSYPYFTRALYLTLEHYGMHDTYESVLFHLKKSVRHAFRHYAFENRAEAKKIMYDIYHEIALKEEGPIPGAAEALAFAREHGKRNFLYTHSDEFPRILLEKWGLLSEFTFIIDSTMGFPSKPSPDALNYLCKHFSLDRDRSLVVGDRDIDVLAGLNAGMHGCLFDDGHFYDDFECEHTIRSLFEMPGIIGEN